MNWYVNRDLRPQGPHTLQEIRNKILRGEVAPGDLLLHEEVGVWQMAIEYREFEQSLFPALQAVDSQGLAQEWVVLREVPEGPYSLEQIKDMLVGQTLSVGQYIWKSGLSGWVQIKDRPEFAIMFGVTTKAEL